MEGLGTFLIFAVLFYLMMRYGCGAHMMHGHGGHDHSEGDDHKDEKQVDPVCGKELESDQGYGKMHQGTLYRFCSRDCLDKFDADPGLYLDKERGERS